MALFYPVLAFIGLTALAVLVHCTPLTVLFTYHPILLTLAFVVFQGSGVVLATRLRTPQRRRYLSFHQLANTASLVCATLGVAVIVLNKQLAGKPHLTSWHAWVGVAALLVQFVQSAIGIAVYFFGRQLVDTFGSPMVVQLKQCHASLSSVCVVFAQTTLGLSLYSNWAMREIGSEASSFLAFAFVVLSLVLVSAGTLWGKHHSHQASSADKVVPTFS